jgi:flagellar basal-body rod modification protein FlgD
MAIESVGAVLDSSSPETRRAGIQQEDFLKILLAQLTYQDPLKPLDNQEYIAQLAQFTSLEQERQSNERLESVLTVLASSQAIGLVGRSVEVRTDTGVIVGEVITARFQDGLPLLNVETEAGAFLTDVSLSQVTLVR